MDQQVGELNALAPGLAHRLAAVSGVDGVLLGGSRARGAHSESSDFDLGIYYRTPLDTRALQAVADEFSDEDCEVTEPGGWGPWVDGGAWLVVDGVHVDLIYRNADRVADVWSDCLAGRFTNERQTGHPLGFWSHAYAGELALGQPVTELSSNIGALKEHVVDYPPALSAALVAALWEATFSTRIARQATEQRDVAYVAGCLFRAVGVTAHALHGHAREWLLNEKGAIASTSRLPDSPVDFEQRVNDAFSSLATDPAALTSACDQLDDLIGDATQIVAA